MELWHEDAGGARSRLAADVDVAETWLQRARGRMFTRRFPEGSALVFPFGGVKRRGLHMVGVPYAIDAVWLVDGEVTTVRRLRPMVGLAWARADTIIELPAGAAADVAAGDRLVVEG